MERGAVRVGFVVSILCLVCALFAAGQTNAPVIAKPGAFKWNPFIPGIEMTVLAGDPSKTGPYTIRLRMTDGAKISPHWHPEDENVTVLRGAFLVGMGEKFDAAALQELPVGSYVMMPKEMRHFAQAKGETVLQLHANGPFVINYVNPADDPAKAKP